MIRWTAPTALTDWLTADEDSGGAANTRLSRLWQAYSGANTTRNRNIWKVGLDESDSDLQSVRAHSSYRDFNMITSGGTFVWANNDSAANKTLKRCNVSRNMLMDGVLVAYGSMGSNADLSETTTLYINRHAAAFGSGLAFATWTDSTGPLDTNTSSLKNNARMQQFFTGKFGGLNFVNVPGWTNFACENQSGGTYDNIRLSQTPGWVLQPTVTGGGEISRFAIANYDSVNKGTPCNVGTNLAAYNDTKSLYYGVPHADEEFIYPKLDGQRTGYDPLRGSSDDTSRFEYTNGSWNSVTSLTDDDTSTSVTCLSSGEANALYVKMTTPANDSGITASSTINSFTVQIQGITIPAVANNDIRFAVTDSSKTTLLSSNDQQSINFGGLTTGTGNKFPTDGSYIVSMTPDSSTTVAYSAVSAGYMKIWLD